MSEQDREQQEAKRRTLLNKVLDFVAPKKKTLETDTMDKESPARAGSYFSQVSSKKRNPLNLSPSLISMLSMVLLAVAVVDLVAFSSIATNRFFTLSGNLIYLFRLDTVTFHLTTLLEVQVIFSLILSAVFGGLLVYWLLKFTVFLSDKAELSVQRRHLLYVLGTLTLFFLTCMIISFCSGHAYDTYETYHYLAPFLTYISGLILYSCSMLRIEV